MSLPPPVYPSCPVADVPFSIQQHDTNFEKEDHSNAPFPHLPPKMPNRRVPPVPLPPNNFRHEGNTQPSIPTPLPYVTPAATPYSTAPSTPMIFNSAFPNAHLQTGQPLMVAQPSIAPHVMMAPYHGVPLQQFTFPTIPPPSTQQANGGVNVVVNANANSAAEGGMGLGADGKKMKICPNCHRGVIVREQHRSRANYLVMMRPPIIMLKEGTENSQGKQQIISNINACAVVADAIRTTLGPRGLDKLIVDSKGNTTISNDGATILKLLDIVFPAASVMVDIAKSQDAEVGDGTTSVVVLAAELLKRAKPFIEDGVHPQLLIRAFSKASEEALAYLDELAIPKRGEKEQRDMLVKCAATTLSSKLVSHERDFFSEMVVDAVNILDDNLPLNMIGIKKVNGGNLSESRLVKGVAFLKAFSYAGFEMQPKHYKNVSIALLNIELELKAEKDNAEMRLTTVDDFQAVVDAEWNILYRKLEKIHESGAKIVLSRLPIGDVATQWFADRDMFCAGRIQQEDLDRLLAACGGTILTTVSQIDASVLGSCETFYEQQVGSERYNFFEGCTKAQACTLLLRGGAEQFIAETERSLHDAIMIVRRAKKNDSIVAGGGAIEMELAKRLREKAKTIAGKEQFFWIAFARSFEIIPQQLCYNAGLDATDILNQLRHAHAKGEKWAGVNIHKEEVGDNLDACIWEPSVIKKNAITAATEAVCLVLSIDQTVKNVRAPSGGQMPGLPGQ